MEEKALLKRIQLGLMNTGCGEFKYMNTTFEQFLFMFILIFVSVFKTIGYFALFISCPIWGIPYIIYKEIKHAHSRKGIESHKHMDVICKRRGEGKTTELVKRSAETGEIILVPTRCHVSEILYVAQKHKLNIPEPITVSEYERGILRGTRYPGILIDDADIVLRQVFSDAPVTAITITK